MFLFLQDRFFERIFKIGKSAKKIKHDMCYCCRIQNMYRVSYMLKIYEKRRFLAVFRQNALFCNTYRVLYKFCGILKIESNDLVQASCQSRVDAYLRTRRLQPNWTN